jgi:hypothetical protein
MHETNEHCLRSLFKNVTPIPRVQSEHLKSNRSNSAQSLVLGEAVTKDNIKTKSKFNHISECVIWKLTK